MVYKNYEEKIGELYSPEELERMTIDEAIRILGFDPLSKKYIAMVYKMTPKKAQIILHFLNKKNRRFYSTQLKKLDTNIQNVGWKKDGGACVFTTAGNLMEFQHRLKTIVELGLTVDVVLVLGADNDAFTLTSPPKARYPIDQIFIEDKSAVKEDETTLRQILGRRGGDVKLGMENAISLWKIWKKTVRKARELSKDVRGTDRFSSWGKEILGFTALMIHEDLQEHASNLLKMMKDDTEGKTNHLMKTFNEFSKSGVISADTTNTEKSNIRFFMLCNAADKIIKKPKGDCEFSLDSTKCNHDNFKQRVNGSVYRKFLVDPDGIAKKYAA